MKRSLLILSFLMTVAAVIAQPYASRLGRFQVDQLKGCAPFTLTLTNLLVGDCTPGKPCVMDYEGNNTGQQNQFSHTYANPGTYKLSVLYQSIGTDDITINVVPNIQPNFEIYACSGNNARIKVVDNNYEQYVIDFDNNGTPENILPFSNNIQTPPHNYAPPGAYVASVRGRNTGSADNCTAKTQPFNSLATLPAPTMNLLTSVDASTIKLDFSTTTNIQYRMEIAVNNSGTFQLLQILYGINTLTIPNLKLDDNFYCFRIGAFDPCTNATTYSGIVCSDKFTATAVSDNNQLVWVTSPGASNYTISRNNVAYFTTSAQIFNDNSPNIVCKTNYCYRVTNNYAGGAKSISLEKCVTAFSTKIPTLVNNTSAVVSSTGVALTWIQDPAFIPVTYTISRSSNSGAYSNLATSTVPKYNDASYTVEDKFCYTINYIDKCDIISAPGAVICPVRLTGKLDKNNAITLTWNSYKGWKNGVKNYSVEKYNLSGVLVRTVTITDTTFLDDQVDLNNQFARYDIKVNSNDTGLTISVSNTADFIKNANLYYPSAFTPNGDNLNDQFIVSGQYIAKINLKIFDRWGALIFATENNEPWNGHKDGKVMPPSTYVWKVEITDLAGRTFSKEGIVTLIH